MNRLTALPAMASARLAHLLGVTMGGKTVTLKNGYPDATVSGICNAVFDSDGFTEGEGTGSVTFIRAGAPSGKQCSVTY